MASAPLLAQTMEENFNDGVADDWTPIAPSTGWSIITSNGSLVYTQPVFDGGFPKSIYNGATWSKGYVLSARVRMNGGGTGNIVGLIYHYISPTNFQAVFVNRATDPCTVQLWRANGGNPAMVATGTFPTPPAGDANWVTLSLERGHDDVTTVKVNGLVIPSLSGVQVLAGAGNIGVIDQFANGQWDDVSVTLLEPEEPEPVDTPEMTVEGNGTLILDGDTSPDAADGTDFGSTPAPGFVDRTFTIRNVNDEFDLTLGDVILTGDFSVVTPPPASLAPGQSGSFTIRFSPTLYFDQTGMVSIANNDPLRNPYNFVVRGTGENVPDGDIEIRGNADAEERVDSLIHSGDTTPTIVDHTDLGGEFVTAAWTARTYTIHNLTSSPRTITGVSLSGSSDFSIIAQPAGSIPVSSGDRINADGRTSFSILFDPSSAGTKTATVTVTHDGTPSPYTFAIRGNGIEGESFTKRAFPRTGGIFYRNNSTIYGSTYTDPVYQQTIAKYDFGVINFSANWGGGPVVMNQIVNNIKALNPDIILTNYTLLESTYDNGQPVALKLHGGTGPTEHGGTWTPNDWWAHHETGLTDTNPNYESQFLTNHTRFVTPDSNGDRYSQFYGKWSAANLISPVTQLDGVFTDNSFYKPRVNMDWDRNGVDDDQEATSVQAYYRTGIADYWAQLNASLPGHLIMGNIGGQPSYRRGSARDAEHQRKVEGALAETSLGSGGSPEGYSGWYNLMTEYRSLMDNTRPPHLVMVGVRTTYDGKSNLNPSQYGGGAPYAFARYALATVLMEDGYIEFHNVGYAELTPPWFDELDLAGTADTSWLGEAIDPPQRAAKQNGVFLRRFGNGLAIVNPRTEPYLINAPIPRTAQTIDLASLFPHENFRRIVGVQDPVTNNGEPVVGPITIQPGDGLILQRYNVPPEADAGPDQTIEVGSDLTAEVTLDGSGSIDSENEPLTYAWSWSGGSATGASVTAVLPIGSTEVTLTVTDSAGASDADTVLIQVVDTAAPIITTLIPSKTELWPPNHKMVAISIAASVHDIADPSPFTRIVSVTSDEPAGSNAPDWEITGDLTLKLRAEREGSGDGRAYTITVQSTDNSGNSSTSITTVVVPHNR